jgi:Chaperone of endosialidase
MIYKRKAAVFLLILSSITFVYGQNIGINKSGVKPDPSAVLDLNTGNNGTLGFLPPQIGLTGTNVAAPVTSPAIGLLIYNTNTAGASPYNVIPGYYYWDGTQWVLLNAGSGSVGPIGPTGATGATGPAGPPGATGPTWTLSSIAIDSTTGHITVNGTTGSGGPVSTSDGVWLLQGNANVLDTTNFIGTTTNVPFNIKVNNTLSGRIDNTRNTVFLGYKTGGKINALNINNTAIGSLAMQNDSSGNDNVGIGFKALNSVKGGNFNTAVGSNALMTTKAKSRSTAVGYEALKVTTGVGNTGVGYGALLANKAGTYNTAIGYLANVSSAALTNATAIGDSAIATASNSIELGNTAVTFTGINGAAYSLENALVVGNSGANGNGAYLTISGTWTNASDRNKKENYVLLNSGDILSKIDSLPILRWNYKGEPASVQHIGPIAQDFYKLFHVGNNNVSISTIDPAGVALIGVQALHKKIVVVTNNINDSIQTLQTENARLKEQLSVLQLQVNAILGAQAAYKKELSELEVKLKDQSSAKK